MNRRGTLTLGKSALEEAVNIRRESVVGLGALVDEATQDESVGTCRMICALNFGIGIKTGGGRTSRAEYSFTDRWQLAQNLRWRQ